MRGIASGSPETPGVTPGGDGVNVAVFSAHATRIELCLFDGDGEREVERITLPERTGDIFHGAIADVPVGTRYGLRAHGPFDPLNGHRFNPAKLLVDPFARQLDTRFALHDLMFGYPRGHHDADLARDDRDSARVVPKCVVQPAGRGVHIPRAWTPRAPPLIYELHVRGMTKLHAAVPASQRGTFAALAHPAVVAHLGNIGVTCVEIMPAAAWIDERHLPPLGLTNYWGYNPVAFCAPELLLAPGGFAEVAGAVDALHAAGIEVVLDVVLNHSGESDELGPTVSLRGLDNATYYRLRRDAPRYYVNDAGCGNILACDRPPVVTLALAALRTWAVHGGIDGFRYDLATTLARRDDGFDPNAALIAAIATDPVLGRLTHIAEPWDIGPGGYQLGRFPPDWAEWNDRFRDDARCFWRGDPGRVGAMATRLAGSADLFRAGAARPSRGVNFITAHDGFTLADLVSHAHKHNDANGEQNRDGTDDNHSWNNGAEGASDRAEIIAARSRDARNLLATLFLARGMPMLCMGDELGRTQGGNNNAYAQDNPTAWLDWSHADEALVDFTASLSRLRAAHPALHADVFLYGDVAPGASAPDVEWLSPSGAAMTAAEWERPGNRCLVAALCAPDGADGDDRVVVALNAGSTGVHIALPGRATQRPWTVALDTAGAADATAAAAEGQTAKGQAWIEPRCVVVFVLEGCTARS